MCLMNVGIPKWGYFWRTRPETTDFGLCSTGAITKHRQCLLIKVTSINSSFFPALISVVVMLTLDIFTCQRIFESCMVEGLKTACSGFSSPTFQPYFVPQSFGATQAIDRRNNLRGSQEGKLSHPHVYKVNRKKQKYTQKIEVKKRAIFRDAFSCDPRNQIWSLDIWNKSSEYVLSE